MSRTSLLRDASLGTQAAVMLTCVSFVTAVMSVTMVKASVLVAVDASPRELQDLRVAMLLAVLVVTACTSVTLLGAVTYLRQSIRRTVRRIEYATNDIADGRFEHRIASTRRDELGSLAVSIDRMAERLHLLEGSRQRLLASVSHELRTPLTVIRGHAFTLARREPDEGRRDRFTLIDDEAERLAALIDDLLAAATLRAAPIALDRKEIPAAQLFRQIAARFASRAGARSVSIRCGSNCVDELVAVDKQRFDQVIGNLVSNAISHAPAGSRVEVRVCSLDAEGEPGVRVSVCNAGPAIPADCLDEIFEPFVQGEQATGSVGLGLSIASDLVRAHGSQLQVTSRDGRTEFWFDLSCALARRPSAMRRLAGARFA